MKLDDVRLNGLYRARVGGRLAPVRVVRCIGSSRSRPVTRFLVRTTDTNRDVIATAARLRIDPTRCTTCFSHLTREAGRPDGRVICPACDLT